MEERLPRAGVPTRRKENNRLSRIEADSPAREDPCPRYAGKSVCFVKLLPKNMKTQKQNRESMERVHERLLGTFKLKDLVERGTLNSPGDAQAQVSGLVTDSRRVTPNSAFFALPGLRTNGNEYLQEALTVGPK